MNTLEHFLTPIFKEIHFPNRQLPGIKKNSYMDFFSENIG